jgi:hypothetical protein
MDVSCFIFYGDSVGEVAKVLNENASPRQSLLNEQKQNCSVFHISTLKIAQHLTQSEKLKPQPHSNNKRPTKNFHFNKFSHLVKILKNIV